MIDDKQEQLLPGLPASSYLTDNPLTSMEEIERFYFQRRRYIREFGFCLFTAECIDALTALCDGKSALEAGSGSGWLAEQLSRRGVEIVAADWTDYRQLDDNSIGYPIRAVFRLDYHGDAVVLLPGQFDIVLLVYPNLDKPFAMNIANAMKPGQVLVFEGEGKGGCTANDEFFEAFNTNFELLYDETAALNKHHRTFPGVSDRWTALRKIS